MYGDNGIRFSTIHSLCYSVLVRAYGLKPESVLSDKDRFKFLTEFHNQLMYKRVAGVPEDLDEFCRKCDEYISEEARNEYYENTKKYIDTHKNAACNTSQYFKMICRNEYEVNGYSCNNNNSCMNYSNADNGYDSKGVYDNKKNSDSPMSVQSAAYENGGTSNTSATYKSDTTSRNKAYLKLVYEQYKKYKLAAGKTAKSILISCGARLAPFDIKELRDLMAYDEMELDMLGDQRTAMFVIISDTDDTFNFVVSILYTQLFNLLCDKADDEHGGRLPYHVRLLLDEFANIGQIPKFDKLIATIRSREISASIILQSQSQLKTIYKDAAETIIGNCDTMLFLGGKESSTLKEISETLGKETIDLYNTSDTRGNSPSFGTNYQKTGKELMSRDELAVMDGSKCILQLRGVRPFLSDKFDITKHKRYKELSDFDKKNEFDVERYLKHELRLLTTEEFDLYEVDVTEQAQG